jgi:ATP-dependent RNA helicase DDX54/DBP10
MHPWLLRALTLQGFRTPTPIQRLAIPALLQNPPRDLVGMARTGSGKSLAYLIPLLQRLGGRHSTSFGARALILLPTRELALQILRVGKALARGWSASEGGDHAGNSDKHDDGPNSGSKSQALRWALVVGGEGLDEQFSAISSNPDVIIATPGRLLHLVVEMGLDLRGAGYVVFDEADRLFEMGFETALSELISRLPPPEQRQTLLLSATLPKSLVEFARAGLSDPKLVRLDAETKISTDLRMAFFSVKQGEKDAALLTLLRDVIKVPLKTTQGYGDDHDDDDENEEDGDSKKRANFKGKGKGKAKAPHTLEAAPHQTLVFAATKHHVEYLQTLLRAAGYSVAHLYGALDQGARSAQMARFRRGAASVLVVTDVAARGIDIPVLAHVVNYDFPHGARVFVHRVGRTARAGKTGWAWSFVGAQELPFLLDLELFLGRPITASVPSSAPASTLGTNAGAASRGDDEEVYTSQLVLGPFARDTLDSEVEYVRALDTTAAAGSLPLLRSVMRKGTAMYERSRGKASQASYRRAKEMSREPARWGLAGAGEVGVHPVLLRDVPRDTDTSMGVASGKVQGELEEDRREARETEAKRRALMEKVHAFQPLETVLEVGSKKVAKENGNAALMRDRRLALEKARRRAKIMKGGKEEGEEDNEDEKEEDSDEPGAGSDDEDKAEVQMADEAEIEVCFAFSWITIIFKLSILFQAVFGQSKKRKRGPEAYRDGEFYMSHYQKDAAADRGYSLRDGASFVEQARTATFDLAGDDGTLRRPVAGSSGAAMGMGTSSGSGSGSLMQWDKKKKKFVRGPGEGADNKKMVRTESGARLPASFRSGRWEEWKTKQRVRLPKIGEDEGDAARFVGRGAGGGPDSGGKRFRHSKMEEAKPLDKRSTDYERKVRQMKKKNEGMESMQDEGRGRSRGRGSSRGRGGDRGHGQGRDLSQGYGHGRDQSQGHGHSQSPARGGSRGGRGGARGGRGGGRGGLTRPTGRYGGKPIGRVKSELKTVDQIRKTRKVSEQRKAKNARPSKRGKR